MTRLVLLSVHSLAGLRSIEFPLRRMYNLGRTMRDTAKQQRHLDELAALGIQVPKISRLPMIYPIADWALSLDQAVAVQGEMTSGEVELALLVADDGLLVGVASDHTDRQLEAINIGWAKQVCPNVLAPAVWPLDEVREHWDALQLESTVTRDGESLLYQQATAADFWPVEQILDSLAGRIPPLTPGTLLLCGTVVSRGDRIVYGDAWTIHLIDPVLGRTLEHRYRLEVLWREVQN